MQAVVIQQFWETVNGGSGGIVIGYERWVMGENFITRYYLLITGVAGFGGQCPPYGDLAVGQVRRELCECRRPTWVSEGA